MVTSWDARRCVVTGRIGVRRDRTKMVHGDSPCDSLGYSRSRWHRGVLRCRSVSRAAPS